MQQVQKQILYKAISEPEFAKSVLNKLAITTFTERESYKELFSIINRYYMTNDTALDASTFLTLAESTLNKQGRSLESQNAVFQDINDLYELDYELTNEEVIGEEIQKYVRQTLASQAIKQTLLEGKLEDEETIAKLVEKLTEVNTIQALGKNLNVIDFFEDTERKKELLSNISTTKIATGFEAFDSIAEGGLARGELGLVIAKSGGGKTLVASNLASNAVKQGKNVIYISLEEKVDRMILRLEQILSKQAKTKLMPEGKLNEGLYDVVQEAYRTGREEKGIYGNLLLVKFMPGEMTPNLLEQTISDLILKKGYSPDVVIIDYPDLMNNPYLRTSENESRAGGRLYEDLRKYAQKFDYICWALSQVNRSGFEKQIIDSSAIEGSKQKINACEAVLAVNQKPEEFRQGYIRLYVDKLRNNSGATYDKMLMFRVLPEIMTIRDEDEEERFAHINLLDKITNDAREDFKVSKKYGADQASNAITAMNGTLTGV